eukprot:TRINITY_DN1053_c0_g1_i2.p1 TRINITY_DN1053_c0_g1~~TRINITY_DN1053_c0_g1_i2.p1  ORF type:complete len:314 (-),score=75.16 TRINITY_DN1053_c0_g1_i2:504-1445(-)
MEIFVPVRVSPSFLPVLKENEYCFSMTDQVSICVVSQKNIIKEFKKGELYLTSLQLIYLCRDSSHVSSLLDSCFGIPHETVLQVGLNTSNVFSYLSSKNRFFVFFKKSEKILHFQFLSSSCEGFLTEYKKIILSSSSSSASVTPSPSVSNSSSLPTSQSAKARAFSTSAAGVGGIIRQVEQKAEETDKTMNVAFKDLSALMTKAKEMVELAEKFSSLKNKTSNEEATFESYLGIMGIPDPVTKKLAGNLYHIQLARELSDFLIQGKVLQKSSGMIPLSDVYCLFNRARGSELISPEDLLAASNQLDDLGLPIR